MTLLGAVQLPDQMLFGADNLVTDGTPAEELPIVRTAQKLWRLEKMPSVVWGFVGNQPVGYEFRDWIQDRTFDSWLSLTTQAASALAPMNGAARVRAEAAAAKDWEGTEILIGGYIGGEPRIHVLDWEGGINLASENPTFVGFGNSPAFVGWFVLVRAVSIEDTNREDAFRLVMDTTVATIGRLGGPVTYESAKSDAATP